MTTPSTMPPMSQTDWNQLDDSILVKAYLKGEQTAFEVLFRKYSTPTTRLVTSIVKNEALAQDVVQEVFLLVHRHLPKFRGQSSFKTWLYRIAVNESLRQMGRAKRYQTGGDDTDAQMNQWLKQSPALVMLPVGATPERLVLEGQQAELVQKAMESLSENHRTILTLYYLEDMSVQEIAEVLHVPAGSVKSRLFYARQARAKEVEPLLFAQEEETETGGVAHVL